MTMVQDEDLRILRDSVGTLLDRAGGLRRARRLRDSNKDWDADVWRELAAAGVLGAAAPEDAGGLGMGLAAAGVVAEEVGRVIAPEPVVPTIGLAIGHVLDRSELHGGGRVRAPNRGPNRGSAAPVSTQDARDQAARVRARLPRRTLAASAPRDGPAGRGLFRSRRGG